MINSFLFSYRAGYGHEWLNQAILENFLTSCLKVLNRLNYSLESTGIYVYVCVYWYPTRSFRGDNNDNDRGVTRKGDSGRHCLGRPSASVNTQIYVSISDVIPDGRRY